jgi:hypothetical protein
VTQKGGEIARHVTTSNLSPRMKCDGCQPLKSADGIACFNRDAMLAVRGYAIVRAILFSPHARALSSLAAQVPERRDVAR